MNRRVLLGTLALLLGVAAFAFRFLSTPSLDNDHFVDLAHAQAILAGDLPIRDFTESGAPLTAVISAAAQVALGEGQFAELILAVTSLGLAAAATAWIAARLTRSPWFGALAGLMQIAAVPRLYSYQKLLLYPLLVILILRYVERRSGPRLVALGIWVAVATLIRHDHGVYGSLAVVLALVIANWRASGIVREGLAVGLSALILLVPYFAYVQTYVGLRQYLAAGIATSRAEASQEAFTWPSPDPLASGAWWIRRGSDPSTLPMISIRWSPSVGDAQRLTYERQWNLLFAEPDDTPGYWQYRVDSPSGDVLRSIITSADVVDTDGINRQSALLDHTPAVMERLRHSVGLDRWAAGPRLASLFTQRNGTFLLAYLVWVVPVLLILGLALARPSPMHRAAWQGALMVTLLSLVTAAGLVREATPNRIADNFGTFPVVFACLLGLVWEARPGPVGRIIRRGLVVTASVAVIWASALMGNARERLDDTRLLEGPAAIASQTRAIVRSTRRWPWDTVDPRGIERLETYVHACTRPSDRLLVIWGGRSAVMNFMTRRPFAGGETRLIPVSRPADTYERQVVQKLQTQRVPFVLSEAVSLSEFESQYHALSRYVGERYRRVGQVDAGNGQRVFVYVDTTLQPSGNDRLYGWPCFTR